MEIKQTTPDQRAAQTLNLIKAEAAAFEKSFKSFAERVTRELLEANKAHQRLSEHSLGGIIEGAAAVYVTHFDTSSWDVTYDEQTILRNPVLNINHYQISLENHREPTKIPAGRYRAYVVLEPIK